MQTGVHGQLSKVRKPRVHITYEVETENGSVEKELPFVIGVLGDFAGDADADQKPLVDRKFINIDRDNFNDVMARIGPRLSLKVPNTLSGDNSEMMVDLTFNSLDDFSPEAIVDQVPALRALLEARSKLRDLLTKADRSPALESILEAALQEPKKLEQLASALQAETDTAGAA